MIHLRLAPLAAGLLLAVPALGLAQPAPMPPPPPADGGQHHGWRGERGEDPMAHHLKAVHDLLGIRPDQEAAFQALAAAMRPPMRDHMHQGPMQPGMPPAMTAMPAPDRLEHALQMMDERHAMMRAHMQQVLGALRGLYAVLTPEQRRILDTLPELGGGHGMGMMHGEGKGRWGGEHPMGPPPPPPPQ